jgi:3-keto-disaccharide hydrolase
MVKSNYMRKLHKLATVLAIALMLVGCDSSISLFDGKSLEGWVCDPLEQAGDWKAVDGELLGENPGEQASIIWSMQKFRDFEVELDYITLTDDYDSGIFIRGLTHQVQIGISRSLQKDMTACIYAPEDKQGSYPGQTDKVTAIHKILEWNHLKVIVTGLRIQTFLNEEPMVDYTGVVLEDEGPIGLQLHGGVHMSVKFKNVKVREL